MKTEPKPGGLLSPEDFETIVRLTPLVSIDLVVRAPEGHILLGERTNEPAKGWLFLPGGRITKGERFKDAFERLTLKELGVRKSLAQARFLGVCDAIYDSNYFGKEGFSTHYVAHGYELKVTKNELHLPAEQHCNYVWLAEEDLLSNPKVHKNTKAFLTGRFVDWAG